jgi:CysZ protein
MSWEALTVIAEKCNVSIDDLVAILVAIDPPDCLTGADLALVRLTAIQPWITAFGYEFFDQEEQEILAKVEAHRSEWRNEMRPVALPRVDNRNLIAGQIGAFPLYAAFVDMGDVNEDGNEHVVYPVLAVVVPLLINIFLFSGLIYLGYSQFAPLVAWMMEWVPGFLAFLEWILWIIFTSVTAVIVFFTFTPFASIIAAPFNAIMAEKIEEMLTGEDINSGVSLGEIIKNSILSLLRKLLYIAIWSVGLLLISLIPLINFISPVLWVVFGSWLLALEYMDFPMGNHDLTFDQQKQRLKTRRGLALGFGGGVMVMTSIPLVNFLVMPIATAGSSRKTAARPKTRSR